MDGWKSGDYGKNIVVKSDKYQNNHNKNKSKSEANTRASVASKYTDLAPLSNTFDNMCIIVLNAYRPKKYWFIVFVLISKSVSVAVRINLSKYMSRSSRTWFFVYSSLRVPMDGTSCMSTMTSMLLNTHACDWKNFLPCLLYVIYWDGSITYMGIVSSVCASCASCCTCSYCAFFSLLHKYCSSISFHFNSHNSFYVSSIFCFSLFLCVILLSCCHLVA